MFRPDLHKQFDGWANKKGPGFGPGAGFGFGPKGGKK